MHIDKCKQKNYNVHGIHVKEKSVRRITMEYNGNNQAKIIGSVEDELKFSHQVYGEKFYIFTLKVPRLSGTFDYIKVLTSERLLCDCSFKQGEFIEIEGQFRSYNSSDETTNKLVLTVFAKDIRPCDEMASKNPNSLFLDGYICKQPVYRTTPFGREITDMLLAVNRTYSKSDYIPVIAWGRNARFCKNFEVGDHIRVWGRIQSRTYQKHLSDEEIVTKTAYEVSVNRLETADEEDTFVSDEEKEMAETTE